MVEFLVIDEILTSITDTMLLIPVLPFTMLMVATLGQLKIAMAIITMF